MNKASQLLYDSFTAVWVDLAKCEQKSCPHEYNYVVKLPIQPGKVYHIIGVSLSEPHTSVLNSGFSYICCTYLCRSVNTSWHSFNQKHCTCRSVLAKYRKTNARSKNKDGSTVLESRRVLLLSSNQEFYLQLFRLQVVLNVDAHKELSNQCRSKKIDDGAETKETELNMLQRQRNKGAKDWESGGHKRTAQASTQPTLGFWVPYRMLIVLLLTPTFLLVLSPTTCDSPM